MIGAGSDLVASFTPRHKYRDPQFAGSAEDYAAACARSNTVYVGNLSFHTTEEQVGAFFFFSPPCVFLRSHCRRSTRCFAEQLGPTFAAL